jgi:hypothetical protein
LEVCLEYQPHNIRVTFNPTNASTEHFYLYKKFCISQNLVSVGTNHFGGIVSLYFYGSETWSLTLREKHRLRVFVNRVLKRIFGSKRDEVAGGWRKLHTEELHNVYSSPSIIRMIKSRRMIWAGHVARM